MDRKPRYRSWTNVLTGTFIGLFAASPAFALADMPFEVHGDIQFYALVGFGLLLVVALVMRAMRSSPVESTVSDVPARYSTRFFPADRPIALE